MKKNIEEAINFYGENEQKRFQQSAIFLELNNLANQLGFLIECSFGYGIDDCKNIYLGFRVVDKNGESVKSGEYDDFSELSDATRIIAIDGKERVKFYSWDEDSEFIDSVNWALKELKKK